MNKDIDYDELDQAVTGAMEGSGTDEGSLPSSFSEDSAVGVDSEQNLMNVELGSVSKRGVHAPISSPSATTAPREDGRAREASPEVDGHEVLRRPATKPKPRGFYLDMVNPKSPMRPLRPTPTAPPKPTPRPTPTKIEHQTEFGVIEDFIKEPTPIEPEILDIDAYQEDPAPNPDNFTLGGRSPFIENAIVEKRPLGDQLPPSHTHSIQSTKNVYSARPASTRRPTPPPEQHEIIETKQPSGIARFLLVLLVIAVGAGIGIGAWYLISSGIITL